MGLAVTCRQQTPSSSSSLPLTQMSLWTSWTTRLLKISGRPSYLLIGVWVVVGSITTAWNIGGGRCFCVCGRRNRGMCAVPKSAKGHKLILLNHSDLATGDLHWCRRGEGAAVQSTVQQTQLAVYNHGDPPVWLFMSQCNVFRGMAGPFCQCKSTFVCHPSMTKMMDLPNSLGLYDWGRTRQYRNGVVHSSAALNSQWIYADHWTQYHLQKEALRLLTNVTGDNVSHYTYIRWHRQTDHFIWQPLLWLAHTHIHTHV